MTCESIDGCLLSITVEVGNSSLCGTTLLSGETIVALPHYYTILCCRVNNIMDLTILFWIVMVSLAV